MNVIDIRRPWSPIPVSSTSSDCIRYVAEESNRYEEVAKEVEAREWDVLDLDSREDAGYEELGDLPSDCPSDWYTHHAMWFLNPKRNAAALAVFRKPTQENVDAWKKNANR